MIRVYLTAMDFEADHQIPAPEAIKPRKSGKPAQDRAAKAAPRSSRALKSGAVFYTELLQEIEALRRQLEEKEQAISELQSAVLVDALTGLYNRRGFHSYLQKAIADVKRFKFDICLLYIDIDRFKAVNDTLGHVTGDKLLKAIAQALQAHVRETDFVCRLGGDEFAILLWHCGPDSARIKAGQLEDVVAEAGRIEPIGSIGIGASIGVVAITAAHHEADLLEEADRRMYERKRSRRQER